MDNNRKCFIVAMFMAMALPANAEEANNLASPMSSHGQSVIENLSPEEQATYNKKLKKAMELYYSRAYHLALPLFQELSQKADTQDILYWNARTARASGATDSAIYKYKTMLERDPGLHPVRLELAFAYLEKGERDLANQELLKLKNENISPELRAQVEDILDKFEGRRHLVRFRGSIGPKYDSNATAQPAEDSIDVGAGVITTSKTDGWFLDVKAGLDIYYTSKKYSNLYWLTQLNVLGNFYGKFEKLGDDIDYSMVDASTGIEYVNDKSRLKIPVGIGTRQYGHEHLSDYVYISPQYEYKLSDKIGGSVGTMVRNETYETANNGQDHQYYRLFVSPNYTLLKTDDKSHMLSATLDYVNKQADDHFRSYEQVGLKASWFAHWPIDVDSYFDLGYSMRDYDSKHPLLFPNKSRNDDRWTANIMANKKLDKNLNLSASCTYLHNDSNLSLWDFDRYVIGLSIGLNTNF